MVDTVSWGHWGNSQYLNIYTLTGRGGHWAGVNFRGKNNNEKLSLIHFPQSHQC